MISPINLKEFQGSIVTIKRTGNKREAYSITGELLMISTHRIILAGTKSGRTHRIPLDKVIYIAELDSDFTVLNFLQDGSGAALSLKKEVNRNE